MKIGKMKFDLQNKEQGSNVKIPVKLKSSGVLKENKNTKFAYKLTKLTNCIECYLETLKFWYLYWLSNKEDTQEQLLAQGARRKFLDIHHYHTAP